MQNKFLIFDTETNGLPSKWSAPISDVDNWPRIVQLAWVLCDDMGHVLGRGNHLVKPEGFVIPESAIRVHGITNEKALAQGLPMGDVLMKFSKDFYEATHVVAHNMAFDKPVLFCESYRNSMSVHHWKFSTFVCTMKNQPVIDYCKTSGGRKKWPKLSELHTILFDEGFEGAHDAMVDVNACANCFFELKRLGIIN